MRLKRYSKKLILFLALSALALFVTCAKKIVNNPTEAISFHLAVSFGNSQLAELVETYQVIIIAGSDSIVAELEMVDGVVEGTIENVPEGTGLLVVLEGLDAGGIVIYRGSALIDVIAGQITEVEIELLPVVKLIRTSPKFLETMFGTQFSSEIELYNLGGLTQIGLTIGFDKATLQLDSVSKGSGLPSGSNLAYSTDSSGKLVVNVSHSATIVDSSGNAVLAQIYFRGTNSNLCKDSTVIDIMIDSLSAQSTTIEEILVDRSKIIINRGRLSLSKNSLQFGFGVPGLTLAFQGIDVIDSCGNIIPFTISTEQDWIDLNAKIGGLTPDSIYIDVDTTGLTTGSYVGSFMVQSPKAVNSPVEVVVTLQLDRGVRTLIVEPGLIAFSADEFGTLPAPQQFTISELNSFNIPFSVSENISWLDLSDTTGTTEQVITANITSTGLAPGTYTDSIEIISPESNNSPQYVRVSYTIGNVPKFLTLDKDTLLFTSNRLGPLPEPQSFVISEQSGFEIGVSVSESIAWLDLNIAGGTTSQSVTASINTTNLESGIYLDSIIVTSTEAQNSPVFEYILFNVEQFVDTFPPSAVTDLAVDSISLTSAFLSWTASGDDSNDGTATETDLRYSTNLSTLLNWDGATQVIGEPAPLISGSIEQFEVVSLIPGNMYYFGLEIIDNANNRSEISNVDSAYLPNLVPDPPLLISPDSGAIDIPVNVTFIWHSAERADIYQLQIGTSASFPNPLVFPNINDSVFLIEPLDYETTYYWRVNAFNDGGNSEWSSVWNFRTELRPPTISGIVSDNNNNLISGAVLKVYDSYPTGNVLDSALTDQNGAFKFFNITGTVEIRTFKTGFYPELTEVITPDTSLTISLTGLATFAVTDKWIDLYCESAMVHGHLVQPNDIIEAYDPNGNLCGRFIVTAAGVYGFMPVYRDDEFSTVDEGCVYGDAVTLMVNQEVAELFQPLVYPADYQNFEVCFDVTGEILSWIVILEPAGGETFFIDSSAAIKWSSIGTSDTLELYLTNPLISPVFVQNIADDGEHTLTIPRTAYISNDWTFVLVDAFSFSPVSDTSNQFTIDAVELAFAPDTLRILGAANKCTPSTQSFEISEAHNYLIPYSSSESISWLSITNAEGNTSSIVDVVTDISGLPLGTYFDSIKIESPDAINSPVYVYVELELREFLCGDFNDDCDLKIGDLANLIDYLYRAGPPPLSADAMNVDRCGGLDIADVEFWYDNFEFSNESNCEGSETCTSSENDNGAADSLKLIVSQPPLLADSSYMLQLDLYIFNDANVVNGLAVGFDWDNPNLKLDSVIFSVQVENSLNLLRVAFESDDIDTSNANQRFLFAGNRSLFPGLEASASQKLLASYYLSLSQWNASDSIVIDTLTFNEGTAYKVISPVGAYQPVWHGPLVIRNESSDK